MRVLDGIKEWLSQRSSVQMVADDPQMASEILLLLRTMFADGKMASEEINMFKMFCSTIFHIPEEDVPDVIRFLKEYGYETSGEQAAAMFADFPENRRRELLVHIAVGMPFPSVIVLQPTDHFVKHGWCALNPPCHRRRL